MRGSPQHSLETVASGQLCGYSSHRQIRLLPPRRTSRKAPAGLSFLGWKSTRIGPPMLQEPQVKRAVAFFDGQNLFHGVKASFGYTFPNYDPTSWRRLYAIARAGCWKRPASTREFPALRKARTGTSSGAQRSVGLPQVMEIPSVRANSFGVSVMSWSKSQIHWPHSNRAPSE